MGVVHAEKLLVVGVAEGLGSQTEGMSTDKLLINVRGRMALASFWLGDTSLLSPFKSVGVVLVPSVTVVVGDDEVVVL